MDINNKVFISYGARNFSFGTIVRDVGVFISIKWEDEKNIMDHSDCFIYDHCKKVK